MTIRRRLALSFGATLLLFCLNLLAHFVTSHQRDASLRHFGAAVQRGLLWTSLEHEYRTRWQELSVLSELPFTADQAREVRERVAQLTTRGAAVSIPNEAPAPLIAFQKQQQVFDAAAAAWLDQRLAGAAGGLETPGDALTQLLDQLTALTSRDEARVSEDSAQL